MTVRLGRHFAWPGEPEAQQFSTAGSELGQKYDTVVQAEVEQREDRLVDCDRRIACRRREGADCLRVGAPVAGPPLCL